MVVGKESPTGSAPTGATSLIVELAA